MTFDFRSCPIAIGSTAVLETHEGGSIELAEKRKEKVESRSVAQSHPLLYASHLGHALRHDTRGDHHCRRRFGRGGNSFTVQRKERKKIGWNWALARSIADSFQGVKRRGIVRRFVSGLNSSTCPIAVYCIDKRLGFRIRKGERGQIPK